MPKQKVDEGHIIKESLRLFRQSSYNKTTMADIAKACGLLKGSLYHYFESKEALMIKVIEVVHDYFKREVFVHAYNAELSAKERMTLLIDQSEAIFFDRDNGCIMGNIGVETALVVPEFAESIQHFFIDFFDAMETVYAVQFDDEKATSLAERTVAEVEGAIMLSRIFNDQKYLKKTHDRIKARLN